MGPLAGLRVVEIAHQIAGPYCTKLLADLGAQVIKIERPGSGDSLRAWGPFPDNVPDLERSGLFHYLNANKEGVTLDLRAPSGVAAALTLVEAADVLVESHRPGALDRMGLDLAALRGASPRLIVVRISNFGQTGLYRDREATGLTLQAASGWITRRDLERAPVQAGARIPEYAGGAFAALGVLSALRTRQRDAGAIEVDVSLFECLVSTLSYPMLIHERMQALGFPTSPRAAAMLGIVRCCDGWIGINALTGQHWLDICAMVEAPEFGPLQMEVILGGPEREVFFAKAQPWLDARGVDEILALSQSFRIPAAPVGDGRTMLECPQYRARDFFVPNSSSALRFTQPGPPYRFSKTAALRPGAVPSLGAGGAHASSARAAIGVAPAGDGPADSVSEGLPFTDLVVLDMSTFWAGAYLTCYLGAFGAEVIKLESIQRPDGHRYSGAFPFEGDDWFERSALWQATNLNKLDITLDLGSEEGRALVERLIAQADVLVENFSPRVMEHFGLDYASLTRVRPDIIQVRMPGFGLEGPWRNFVGWALGIEQATGMAAATGYADGPPLNLQGPADPIIGVHGGVALLAALEHRRRTGQGQLIEVAQIEAGACVTAELVIEYSMNGVVRAREGNRQRGHVQGVYPTDTDGVWVAIAVRNDRDWEQLLAAMTNDPARRGEVRLATQQRRIEAHDEIDQLVTQWTRSRAADAIVDALQQRGVPAARLLTPDRMYAEPQLNARDFYCAFDHPVSGVRRYPGWPLRLLPGPRHHHRSGPPTLGQHNGDILSRRLGLSADEIERLKAKNVIGVRPLNL